MERSLIVLEVASMFEELGTRNAVAATCAAVVAAAAALLAPAPAEACTPARCTGGIFSLDGANAPANLQSFLWQPRVDRSLDDDELADHLNVTVIAAETGDSVPVKAERVSRGAVHVDFQEPLVPGRTYEFKGENECEHAKAAYKSTFAAIDRARRPGTVLDPSAGPLEIGDQTIAASGGSCGYPTKDVEAGIRRVRTRLTDEMKPWTEVWETTAQVRKVGSDTFQNWEPPSTVQRPTAERREVIETTLVTACESVEDSWYIVSSLEPGRYDVRFRISLPATDWAIHSDPTTVELRCSHVQPDDVGPGHDIGPDHDIGPGPDAGPGGSDSGEGNGLGWSEENGSGSGIGGCAGCSSSESKPLSAALVVILLLGLVGRRARR